MLHTCEAGLRVPRDLSIVARDSNPVVDAAVPGLACYNTSTTKLARRTVRLVSALLAGRRVPARPSLVMPAFVAGMTLNASPTAAALSSPRSTSPG